MRERTLRRTRRAGTAVVLAAGMLAAGGAAGAQELQNAAPMAEAVVQQASQHVQGQYIVALEDNAPRAAAGQAADLADRYGAEVTRTFSATFNGFTIRDTSGQDAKRLAADPSVKAVYEDGTARATGEQPNPPSWGLDQTDQKTTSLDKKYTYPNTADSVTAYVIDSGVNKNHTEFEGRASFGYDFVDDDTDASDCYWHGTHVAGTIAGKTVGIAKKAKVVAVRSLGCDGSAPDSATVAALEWVATNGKGPAVVNMSLGMDVVGVGDQQVKALVAKGFVVAVAGGNDGKDSCSVSPARVPEAITVGWMNQGGSRSGNYGTCLDLFAPGGNIYSSDHTGSYRAGSGTSMATPHVAGAAAMYLEANKGATPQQVRDALVNNATPNLVTSPGVGSPNKLLYTSFIKDGGQEPVCGIKSNTEAVPIPDSAEGSSSITQDKCEGRASATLPVKVDIDHTYSADLAIDLIGPSGATYALKRAGGVGTADGVHQTFAVNASAENANGTWKLRVKDAYKYDTGVLTGWSITF
ncbi:S8 family peptidase [Streptomyces zagrosensis]|uniref:Subtilisin family serine protease n=1 Tax=Streptomyces zagrosensis TaxID=1042984 RepID=A0A7W9UY16_9ACTN|nr:S8 family serine peptidase [Streptomyces zagrosensis]MBB5935445.1 subtilisin family serine protease [Streptomyces zagrosensis]